MQLKEHPNIIKFMIDESRLNGGRAMLSGGWEELSLTSMGRILKLATFTCTLSKVFYISFPLVHTCMYMYIENTNTPRVWAHTR